MFIKIKQIKNSFSMIALLLFSICFRIHAANDVVTGYVDLVTYEQPVAGTNKLNTSIRQFPNYLQLVANTTTEKAALDTYKNILSSAMDNKMEVIVTYNIATYRIISVVMK